MEPSIQVYFNPHKLLFTNQGETISDFFGYRAEFINSERYNKLKNTLKKEPRERPGGGLGVSPCFLSPPRMGDFGG